MVTDKRGKFCSQNSAYALSNNLSLLRNSLLGISMQLYRENAQGNQIHVGKLGHLFGTISIYLIKEITKMSKQFHEYLTLGYSAE